MGLKGLLFALLALCASHVTALSVTNSNWIWTDSSFKLVDPGVTRDFRRNFTSPAGKTAVSAQIIITADNIYTFFVNGQLVGQGNNWEVSQQYCTVLNPSFNVFAVIVQNQATSTPSPAALIAAIQVNYADGTSDTIITDDQWHGNSATPGFQSIGFDDSSWPKAYIAGPSNAPSWHVPLGPYDSSSLNLNSSFWVWTDEVPPNSPTSAAPTGHRAFRKTFNLAGGSNVRTGTILVGGDDSYTLYINGKLIGRGNDYTKAQRWKFTLDYPTNVIVVAIDDYNFSVAAGIIVAIAFDSSLCACTSTLFNVTDGTWKFGYTVPAGFEQPSFDDSTWKPVVIEGAYGVKPWGTLTTVDGN